MQWKGILAEFTHFAIQLILDIIEYIFQNVYWSIKTRLISKRAVRYYRISQLVPSTWPIQSHTSFHLFYIFKFHKHLFPCIGHPQLTTGRLGPFKVMIDLSRTTYDLVPKFQQLPPPPCSCDYSSGGWQLSTFMTEASHGHMTALTTVLLKTGIYFCLWSELAHP